MVEIDGGNGHQSDRPRASQGHILVNQVKEYNELGNRKPIVL